MPLEIINNTTELRFHIPLGHWIRSKNWVESYILVAVDLEHNKLVVRFGGMLYQYDIDDPTDWIEDIKGG